MGSAAATPTARATIRKALSSEGCRGVMAILIWGADVDKHVDGSFKIGEG